MIKRLLVLIGITALLIDASSIPFGNGYWNPFREPIRVPDTVPVHFEMPEYVFDDLRFVEIYRHELKLKESKGIKTDYQEGRVNVKARNILCRLQDDSTYFSLPGNAYLQTVHNGIPYKAFVSKETPLHLPYMYSSGIAIGTDLFSTMMSRTPAGDFFSTSIGKYLNKVQKREFFPTAIFQTDLDENWIVFGRAITKENHLIVSRNLMEMNRISPETPISGYCFNPRATIATINRQAERVAEASSMMNLIHIYDIDGPFARTLCIGDTMDKESDIIKTVLEGSQPVHSFKNMYSFDNFFTVQFLEEYNENKKISSILIIGWDGTPLSRIKLDCNCFDYTVNTEDNELFVFIDEKTILRYDISGLLLDSTICAI